MSACELSPINEDSSNGATQLKDTSLDTTPTTESTDTELPDTDTEQAIDPETPINSETLIDSEALAHRQPMTTTTENTSGYHDHLTPIEPDALGLSPEMILENENLAPLVNYLINNEYNFTYGKIGYVKDADSIYVLSNKLNHLPEDYVPSDLIEPEIDFYFSEALEKRQLRSEAATHMEDLFAAAKESGYNLLGASGYRSYSTQKAIYERNVANRGVKATDEISSRPGHSEHQTGLALDVTLASLDFHLVDALGELDEGIWLKDNAHRFGFIIRYPKEDVSITGYNYEPWHLRYIGEDVATFLHEHELTVEELYVYIESLFKENTGL